MNCRLRAVYTYRGAENWLLLPANLSRAVTSSMQYREPSV